MLQRDRSRCLDAAVKRGAECNTDHHLLCVKMNKLQRTKKPPEQVVNVVKASWPMDGKVECDEIGFN